MEFTRLKQICVRTTVTLLTASNVCFQLFHFDVEVKQVLEVLAGKTMEQSLIEVMEEEELANIREQQTIFTELRNAEMAEMQRLEEQERRRRQEKVRRTAFVRGVSYRFLF